MSRSYNRPIIYSENQQQAAYVRLLLRNMREIDYVRLVEDDAYNEEIMELSRKIDQYIDYIAYESLLVDAEELVDLLLVAREIADNPPQTNALIAKVILFLQQTKLVNKH
jgi:hypothetical protein